MAYYVHPRETWDKKKCERMAKRIVKDGMGTSYPWPGYIGSWAGNGCGYGRIRYNGGCVREEEWYEGEEWLLPIVHKDYVIIRVPSWGYRIIRA